MTSEIGYVIDIKGETVETIEEHDTKLIKKLANLIRDKAFSYMIDAALIKIVEERGGGIGIGED